MGTVPYCTRWCMPTSNLHLHLVGSARIQRPAWDAVQAELPQSIHSAITSEALLTLAGLAQGQRENMKIPAPWELTGWKGKQEQGMKRRHCIHMADNSRLPCRRPGASEGGAALGQNGSKHGFRKPNAQAKHGPCSHELTT